jgi:hypothetical protein
MQCFPSQVTKTVLVFFTGFISCTKNLLFLMSWSLSSKESNILSSFLIMSPTLQVKITVSLEWWFIIQAHGVTGCLLYVTSDLLTNITLHVQDLDLNSISTTWDLWDVMHYFFIVLRNLKWICSQLTRPFQKIPKSEELTMFCYLVQNFKSFFYQIVCLTQLLTKIIRLISQYLFKKVFLLCLPSSSSATLMCFGVQSDRLPDTWCVEHETVTIHNK